MKLCYLAVLLVPSLAWAADTGSDVYRANMRVLPWTRRAWRARAESGFGACPARDIR